MSIFPCFFACFLAVSLNFKNDEEGHRASFLVFWARSKAVSLNAKNGAEGQRPLFSFFGRIQKRTRAGERHQLVGHQMNEQVRHRAVQALEDRARSPERVLTPLSGILGTRSVGKPAMKLWRR